MDSLWNMLRLTTDRRTDGRAWVITKYLLGQTRGPKSLREGTLIIVHQKVKPYLFIMKAWTYTLLVIMGLENTRFLVIMGLYNCDILHIIENDLDILKNSKETKSIISFILSLGPLGSACNKTMGFPWSYLMYLSPASHKSVSKCFFWIQNIPLVYLQISTLQKLFPSQYIHPVLKCIKQNIKCTILSYTLQI